VKTEPLPGLLVTHHARELAREGKAEPRPAVAARGQGICLGEVLKQLRLLFGGQTDAAIRDRKLDPVASVLAHPRRPMSAIVGDALLGFCFGSCLGPRGKREDSCVLPFIEPRQQHDLAIGELERVMIGVKRALVDLAKDRNAVFRPIRRNSIRRKISGMKSAKKSSRTTRLNPWMPCALSSGRQSSISSAIPNWSALSPPSPISSTHSDVETV
jgi:hypothetical protein